VPLVSDVGLAIMRYDTRAARGRVIFQRTNLDPTVRACVIAGEHSVITLNWTIFVLIDSGALLWSFFKTLLNVILKRITHRTDVPRGVSYLT